MAKDSLKVILGVIIGSLLVTLIFALAGANVNVHSTNIWYRSNSQGYSLDSHEVDGVVRFSILDTKDGNTYIFTKQDASIVVPPMTGKDSPESPSPTSDE